MRECPNPECPFRAKHGYAAEYTEQAETCGDCGTSLVPAGAATPYRTGAETTETPGRPPWGRLLATLAVPIAWMLARRIPMPAIEPPDELRGSMDPAYFCLVALGVTAFLEGFVLVEIAAWLVPRWRKLRSGDPAGRARLVRASTSVGLLLLVVQAIGVVTWMRDADVLSTDSRIDAAVVLLTLVAGSCGLVALARLVDRHGLGSGFALLLASEPLLQLLEAEASALDFLLLLPPALVAAFLLTQHRRGSALRQPLCGIVPFVQVGAVAPLASTLGLMWIAFAVADGLAGIGFVAVFAALWSLAFHPVRRIAALAASSGAPVEPQSLRRTLLRDAALVAAVLTGIAIAIEVLAGRDVVIHFAAAAWMAAEAIDVGAHWRAHVRHASLVPVWRLDRTWEIAPAEAVLARARIPVFARGAHARALLHFFGPYLPIEILVPSPRVEEAKRLLHSLFVEGADQAGGAVDSSR